MKCPTRVNVPGPMTQITSLPAWSAARSELVDAPSTSLLRPSPAAPLPTSAHALPLRSVEYPLLVA